MRSVICKATSLDNPVTNDDELAAESGIKCISSWIQHGVGVGLEESIHLIEPLLATAHNENLSEVSLDAITHFVNHPEAHRFPNILMRMLAQLLTLQDLLKSLRFYSSFDVCKLNTTDT